MRCHFTLMNPSYGMAGGGIGQCQLSQIHHAVTESADTWKDELLRRADVVRIGSDPHVVPKPSQCVFKTAKVVYLVIDNSNHMKSSQYSFR